MQAISPAISHAGKKYVHNFPSSTAPLAHTLTILVIVLDVWNEESRAPSGVG